MPIPGSVRGGAGYLAPEIILKDMNTTRHIPIGRRGSADASLTNLTSQN